MELMLSMCGGETLPKEGAFKKRPEAREGMSYLSLEEKRVSGESRRKGKCSVPGECMEISRKCTGSHVV